MLLVSAAKTSSLGNCWAEPTTNGAESQSVLLLLQRRVEMSSLWEKKPWIFLKPGVFFFFWKLNPSQPAGSLCPSSCAVGGDLTYLLLHPLSCSSLGHDHFRASVKHHPRRIWKKKKKKKKIKHWAPFSAQASTRICKTTVENHLQSKATASHIFRDSLRKVVGYVCESQACVFLRSRLSSSFRYEESCLSLWANQGKLSTSLMRQKLI